MIISSMCKDTQGNWMIENDWLRDNKMSYDVTYALHPETEREAAERVDIKIQQIKL